MRSRSLVRVLLFKLAHQESPSCGLHCKVFFIVESKRMIVTFTSSARAILATSDRQSAIEREDVGKDSFVFLLA